MISAEMSPTKQITGSCNSVWICKLSLVMTSSLSTNHLRPYPGQKNLPAKCLRVVGFTDLNDVQQGLHAGSPKMSHVQPFQIKQQAPELIRTIDFFDHRDTRLKFQQFVKEICANFYEVTTVEKVNL